MAPTEAQILENYLLRPAGLEAILTYEWFLERFPAHQRSNPQVRALWQDLVAQRDKALQEVRASIEAEARRGQAMKREVLKEKRQAEMEELDGEIELERAVRVLLHPHKECILLTEEQLFGAQSGAKAAKHSLDSIVPELDGATSALEVEIEKLKQEEAALLDSVRQTIGSLSDLRHGKFGNSKIREEVLESLATLQGFCTEKT